MGAFIQSMTSESWLASTVKKIWSMTMGDWLKVVLGVGAAAIITWNMVQVHDYRLDKIEGVVARHLEQHEEQNKDIQHALNVIQVDIAKLVVVHGR